MMKTVKVQLLALLAIFAFSAATVTACGGKKEDKGKTEKKAGGDKAKAGDVDVCAKALKCKDALAKVDPEQAKSFDQAWKFIETLEGDKKIEQCNQLLQGAGYNPKAPPECK